jgi:putative thiamine transport system ATP-binding protein
MSTGYLRLSEAQLRLPQRTLTLPAIDLAHGEILAVMGPSGCGKSSWLRWLLGDQQSHVTVNGQIELAGSDITTRAIEQRGIGIVWQDFLLFPQLTVLENLRVALPLQRRQLSAKQQQQFILQRLEQVELAALAQQPVTALSGGQRARIALLRALINEPRLLLLDEPFAALDSDLRQRIREWTFATLRAAGTSAILVSHDRSDFPPGCACLEWPQGASDD